MISVCVATYNGARFLAEQLNSILAQLGAEDELLISDDGSTDGTMAVIKKYQQDPRIKILQGPQQGLIANFEHAIKHTNGDIIFLADQDDVWKSGKVKKTMAAFQKNPEVLVVISDLEIVDEELNQLTPSYFDYRQVKTGFIKNVIKNKYIGAGMAFRQELKKKILPIPVNIPMHDMWIGLLAGNQVYLIDEPLTLYRRHAQNASEIQTTSSFKQKLAWRYALITNLLKRMLISK